MVPLHDLAVSSRCFRPCGVSGLVLVRVEMRSRMSLKWSPGWMRTAFVVMNRLIRIDAVLRPPSR